MSGEQKRRKKRKYDEILDDDIIEAVAEILAQFKRAKQSKRTRRSRSPASSSKKRTQQRRHRSSHPHPRCCCCCNRQRNPEAALPNANKDDKMERIAAALHSEDPPQLSSTLLDSAERHHAPLVNEWVRIIREGLGSTELQELAKKYNPEENCPKELQAPHLNIELSKSLDSATLKVDETFVAIQNRSAVQMSLIENVFGTIIQKGKQSTEVAHLVENLHDIARTTADFHHTISLERRRLICVALGIDDVDVQIEKAVGENLFGQETAMMLWKQKAELDLKDILAAWKEEIMPSHGTVATQTDKIVQNGAATQTDVATQRSETTQTNVATQRSEGTQTSVTTRTESTNMDVQDNVPQAVIAPINAAKIAQEEASVETNPQRLVAKIEGARVAKEEESDVRVKRGVPSPDETYPGMKEVVKRAIAQRSFPASCFPKLAESTWNSYATHIRSWWKYCQENKVDVAEPTPEEVIKFYRIYVGLRGALLKCRSALGKVIPNEIAKHDMIINFFNTVKQEPK